MPGTSAWAGAGSRLPARFQLSSTSRIFLSSTAGRIGFWMKESGNTPGQAFLDCNNRSTSPYGGAPNAPVANWNWSTGTG